MIPLVIFMQSFLIIANALAFLASIVLMFSFLNRHNVRKKYKQVIMGIMFGLGAILTLNQPLIIDTGVQVDARNLFIGFAGATAGIIGASIALVISGTTRILIGGVGVWPGLISMGFSAIMGLMWLRLEQSKLLPQRLRWPLLGAMISSSILILLLLPSPIGWNAFTIGGPVLLIIYIIGSLILGFMVQSESSFDIFRHNLIRHSETDPLTGTLNRRGLQNSFQQVVRSEKYAGVSAIMLDINKFKLVNDTFGHDIGDQALRDVVSRVKSIIRSEDIFVRLGGDEFVIISFNLNYDIFHKMINRLNDILVFDSNLPDDNRNLRFSVSAGGFLSETAGVDLNKLLILADREMMSVKSCGRK